MKTTIDLKPIYARAYKSALEYVSEQTGFLHYTHEDPASREQVPIFENLAYALAGLKTHQSEVMLQARDHLRKILPFQTREGAFPTYLHEYPQPTRPTLSVFHLAALRRILEGYKAILGKELQKEVQEAHDRLQEFVSQKEMTGSRNLIKQALLGLELDPFEVENSQELNEVILAKDLAGAEIEAPWHEGLQMYIGPLKNEMQDGYEPRRGLVDSILGAKGTNLPTQLLSVLLVDPMLVYPHLTDSLYYQVDSNPPTGEYFPKGFHHFRLATKGHTFVCQDRGLQFSEKREGESIRLDIVYPDRELEDKDNDVECNFYLNLEPLVDLFVDGEKASIFYEGDSLEMHFDEQILTLRHKVIQGEGKIIGHTARGNRPSQVATDAKKSWRAYDWRIAFRTLKRTPKFTLQITLESQTT